MTTAQKILLTLADGVSFARRDFKNALGIPVVVQRGQTIAVTEAIADDLTSEDNDRIDADGEAHPRFVVAADDAKVDHDFVTKADPKEVTPRPAPVIEHDPSVLPKTEQLVAAINENKRTQRAPRAPRGK